MFRDEQKVAGQRIFEAVLEHLAKQKEQSLDDRGETCRYRGHDGKMCAIGALIDDEDYKPMWDDPMDPFGVQSVCNQVEEQPRLKVHLGWMLGHRSLLSDLQFLHDSSDHWERKDVMLEAAMTIASRYRLDSTRVHELVSEIFRKGEDNAV